MKIAISLVLLLISSQTLAGEVACWRSDGRPVGAAESDFAEILQYSRQHGATRVWIAYRLDFTPSEPSYTVSLQTEHLKLLSWIDENELGDDIEDGGPHVISPGRFATVTENGLTELRRYLYMRCISHLE